MVDLVEIDVVRAEAAERGLDGVEDVLARYARSQGRALVAPEYLVATMKSSRRPFQPAPEDRLYAPDRLERAAERIHIGGV